MGRRKSKSSNKHPTCTLREATLHAALVKFGHQNLWEEYILRSNWSGTSEQWVKRFAVRCPGCQIPIEKNGGCDHMIYYNKNPYGTSFFGVGTSFPYSGTFPQQGFGQYGSTGGFFNSGVPFSGGNIFQSSPPLSPPAVGFPPQSIGAQFGQGFNFPSVPSGFGYPSAPYMPPIPQPQYGAPFPPEPYPYPDPHHFGSGSYGRTRSRSRHSSRRRSKPRHRSRSSSSSSDEHRRRGSPFGHPGGFYGNLPPFANVPPIPPRGGSPINSPRPPAW
ncbi:unnamed protein product [Rotaria sp. Silwood1]|nr:unnamed protein product [Rotaria sp. Silwood1]CAF3464515.1 unnamed protein product [Rotaria sp. Silwood1]CAF4785669.1 unnamed protein product [Rotaria sp. Silwood1]